MDSTIDIINKIKARPSMYLTRNYISCLRAFLMGWYLRNPNTVTDGDLLGSFQDWIQKKYRINSPHSWDSILLFYSEDECSALKLFFQEFDTFLKDLDKKKKKIKGGG